MSTPQALTFRDSFCPHNSLGCDAPLLFKCSPKIIIMPVRHSGKQTLAVIVHTISIVKKIAKDGQSGILVPFGVKKQKSTLAAYCNLENVESIKYLGVTITSDLRWNTHVSNVCTKANRTLGFLRRNLYSCPQEVKEAAYKGLVRPDLD